jgi:hypothetical protein
MASATTPCRQETASRRIGRSRGAAGLGALLLWLVAQAHPAAPGGPVTAWATDAFCTLDCSGNGIVEINEAIRAVNIALGGAPLASCERADKDQNGAVNIDELVDGVSKSLLGCPRLHCS